MKPDFFESNISIENTDEFEYGTFFFCVYLWVFDLRSRHFQIYNSVPSKSLQFYMDPK